MPDVPGPAPRASISALSGAWVGVPAGFERRVGRGALFCFAAASGVAAPSGWRRERSRLGDGSAREPVVL
eukprot:6085319-Alexandrium_andersonii.AAC.1